ncbi:MAG: Chitinase [Pedosphaera sp.]|nr:Chitinase [Pedosphaera sp.]
MKKLCLTILLFGVCCAIRARADVLVYDSLFSLNPNPVHISTGEAVFWTDADGGGPYGIYATDGSWNTVTDNISGIRFTQAGTYNYSDDNGNFGTITVTLNIPPSVTITNPANHAVFSAPATFNFAVTASDTDVDGLSDVEFYVGANPVDDIYSAPFTTLVTNLSAGSYTLTAIAYDYAGATATNSISITVGAAAITNLPPALAGTLVGNQMVITWNTNNATGLFLQSTTNLISNASWAAVTNKPVLIGGQLVVTNQIVGPRQFFRLSNH